MSTNKKFTIIQVNSYGMGDAEEDLKVSLIKNYFTLLDKENRIPHAIIFYAQGVKLLCNDSPVLEILKTLSERNVKILACKTCLNYYQLANKIEIGIIATMIDIIDLQFTADKIISI